MITPLYRYNKDYREINQSLKRLSLRKLRKLRPIFVGQPNYRLFCAWRAALHEKSGKVHLKNINYKIFCNENAQSSKRKMIKWKIDQIRNHKRNLHRNAQQSQLNKKMLESDKNLSMVESTNTPVDFSQNLKPKVAKYFSSKTQKFEFEQRVNKSTKSYADQIMLNHQLYRYSHLYQFFAKNPTAMYFADRKRFLSSCKQDSTLRRHYRKIYDYGDYPSYEAMLSQVVLDEQIALRYFRVTLEARFTDFSKEDLYEIKREFLVKQNSLFPFFIVQGFFGMSPVQDMFGGLHTNPHLGDDIWLYFPISDFSPEVLADISRDTSLSETTGET